MKGGKEEQKTTGPMFPRLHVNDADKGGLRPPPRNKMALFEQLSMPSSQRFGSAAPALLPLPPHNSASLVSSASSSQCGGPERRVSSSFCMPPQAPLPSSEKVLPFDGVIVNATPIQSERRSIKHANSKFLDDRGLVAVCSSLSQGDSSSQKKSSAHRFNDEEEDDDDFTVPTFLQPITADPSNDKPMLVTEKGPVSCTSSQLKSGCASLHSLVQLSKPNDRPMGKSKISDLRTRKIEISKSGQRPAHTSTVKEHKKKSVTPPDTNKNHGGPPKFFEASFGHDLSNSRSASKNSNHGSVGQYQEICDNCVSGQSKCLDNNDNPEYEDALRPKNGSSSLDKHTQSPNLTDNCNQEHDAKVSELPRWDYVERNEASDSSMVDSISGLEISPDDAVGVLGTKNFWKARRVILNQQRVFAIQVFELHTLIKVQKLIASSPHLLLECNSYLKKSSEKTPTNNVQRESLSKFQALATKQKDDLQKAKQGMEHLTDRTVGFLPLPQHEDDIEKAKQLTECSTERITGPSPLAPCEDELHREVNNDQNSITNPNSGNHPPAPVTFHQKHTPWCFHPHTNQWLVPVMSPSEGLIYKPYAAPCPPAGGFMPPFYGGYGPLGLPSVLGNFMNSAYGIPAFRQQSNVGVPSNAPLFGPNCFPSPLSMQVRNPIISGSFTGLQSPGQTEQSSCSMSNSKSEVGTCQIPKASKQSKLQLSTMHSSCEETQVEGRNACPLFPVALATEVSAQQSSCSSDRQTRVIKVAPQNARSASGMAERIFQSIQKERQQYDA